MITNREIATVVWLVILFVFVATKPEVREEFVSLWRAFLRFKIIVPLLLFAGWLAGWVWLASEVGLWQFHLLKDTSIWFVVSGLVLLMNAMRTSEDDRFVWNTVRSTLEASAILGFFLNIVSFSLVVELVLLPVLAFLVMAPIISERDAQLARSKRLFEVLLAIASGVLILLTAVEVYRQRDALYFGELWRSSALSVWLPIVALPFVYTFALIMSYELAFMRFGFANGRRRAGFKTRLAVVIGLHGRVRDIPAFAGAWTEEVASAPTFCHALQRVRAFQRYRSNQRAEEQEEKDRLQRFVGVKGLDADGRPLDQREFAETKGALRWLATCHMGWYRNHGSQYQSDLLERLGEFTSKGLPAKHNIEMMVQSDGQAWFAWRRTVGGWVFAISAAAKPPDQWLYDRPGPPAGFPGAVEGWDHFAPADKAKNW